MPQNSVHPASLVKPVLPLLLESETRALHQVLSKLVTNHIVVALLVVSLPLESQGKIGHTLLLMADAYTDALALEKHTAPGKAAVDGYLRALKALGRFSRTRPPTSGASKKRFLLEFPRACV